MRLKVVAGNWKMNLGKEEAFSLTAELIGMLSDETNNKVKTILLPSSIYLNGIVQQVKGINQIAIGAQNSAAYNDGAYTGEVSARMLKSIGVSYCLVGHSERRIYFNEVSSVLNKKIELLLQQDICPIYCFGETLEIRESDNYKEAIKQQLEETVFKLTAEEFTKLILAYEPVWAIGTGKTATPQQAQEIHLFVRELIASKFNKAISDNTTILYGGSCNEKNAQELFSQPDIDGGLIGGASLKSRSFTDIVKQLEKTI